jgi:hypothetical protein
LTPLIQFTRENNPWKVQTVEYLKLCNVVSLANGIQYLNQFFEVQKPIPIGIHQSKSSLNLKIMSGIHILKKSEDTVEI